MKLTRRSFAKQLAAMAAGGLIKVQDAPAQASHGGAARPNILWLVAEDCCPDLGCYGNTLAVTPRLDALAAKGYRFINAFCSAPVCSPSRSGLITGMYATSIGAHHHRSHRKDGYRLPKGVRPITEVLREAGYFTSNGTYRGGDTFSPGKSDFNFTVEKPFDGVDWRERPAGKPFFAMVNFSEAHRGDAWREIKQRKDRTDPARVTVPPYYPDDPVVRQDLADYYDVMSQLDEKAGRVLDRLAGDGLLENTVVFFFGDNGRPWVRGKQWLYEGGIHVPLLFYAPERFRPRAALLSGMITRPGRARILPVLEDPPTPPHAYVPGGVGTAPVSLIDVSATTLLLAGLPVPECMEGRNLFGGPAPGYVAAARDRCDETPDRIRCVRTARYKYIRNYHPEWPYAQPNRYVETNYPVLDVLKRRMAEGALTGGEAVFMQPRKPEEELYDLVADPHEVNNLADAPGLAGMLAVLRQTMDRWIVETGDQGALAEPESARARE